MDSGTSDILERYNLFNLSFSNDSMVSTIIVFAVVTIAILQLHPHSVMGYGRGSTELKDAALSQKDTMQCYSSYLCYSVALNSYIDSVYFYYTWLNRELNQP